jgi:ABC-2 type transport system permease protein
VLLRTWMIVWKEFLQISRDRRSLAVVIILPLLMLIIYGYAINFDLRHLAVGVQDDDRTPESRELVDGFTRGIWFRIAARFDSPAATTRALDAGEVKAVIVIPRGYARDLASGRAGRVQFLVDGSDSTSASTAIGYANGIFQERSTAVTVAALRRKGISATENLLPVEARFRYWYNPEQKSTHYIVPGLVAVLLMMMSTLLTAMTVVRERERGTIEQIIVSPLRPMELMVGKLVPYVAIAFFDVILITVAGRVLFGVPMVGSASLLLALSAVFLTAALGIGLFISVTAPSQRAAQALAVLISQLPSVLLSGFMFPISAMPPVVQWITNVVPARHFIVIVRSIFLKGVGLEVLWRPTLILAGFGALILTMSARRFRKKL